VLGYVRALVSRNSDDTPDGRLQRGAIETACARGRWRLLQIYEDGVGGGRTSRGQFAAAVEQLAAGRADGLVVARLDRLCASVAELARLLERCKTEGWSVIALDVGFDTATRDGGVAASAIAIAARIEHQLAATRTREGLAQQQLRGRRLGRPEALPTAVRDRIHELRQRGNSLSAIVRALTEDCAPTAHGGRWHATTIRRVLQRQ
jgi:DNA invertase Pin-like site-specific DNA recombinase